MTSMPAPSTSRYTELDSLRGMLAIYVMLVHFTSRFHELYGHTSAPSVLLAGGLQRVQVLFAISGFVISLAIERAAGPAAFIYGRVTRLFPAYWLAVLLTFAVVAWAGLPGREVSAAQALLNLSMLQEFLGVPHVDGAYWTLCVELIFYFWMAVLYFSPARAALPSVLAVWFVVALVVEFAIRAKLPAATYIGKIVLGDWVSFFGIGILARRAQALGSYDFVGSLLSIAAVVVAGVCESPMSAVTAACNVLMFAAMLRNRLVWLRAPWLVFLGTIAYPLYLLHQNIGYVSLRWLEARGVKANLAIVTSAAGMLVLATGVAFVVERPAMRWLRGKIGGRGSRIVSIYAAGSGARAR